MESLKNLSEGEKIKIESELEELQNLWSETIDRLNETGNSKWVQFTTTAGVDDIKNSLARNSDLEPEIKLFLNVTLEIRRLKDKLLEK